MEYWWTGERRYWEKSLRATLYAKHRTWNGLSSNPALDGEGATTDRLGHARETSSKLK